MRGVLRPPLARSFLSDFGALSPSIDRAIAEKALSCPVLIWVSWSGLVFFFQTPFILQLPLLPSVL